jgi:hypothetical protein
MQNTTAPVSSAATKSPYAGQTITKPPSWTILVGLDILLNNLSIGLFLVVTLGALLAPAAFRPLAPLAYPAALFLLALDLGLLVSDLGDPLRFHHMLRVFKPGAPMSVGTWSLTLYGMCLALPALVGVLAWPLFAGIRQLLPIPLWEGAVLLAGVLAIVGLLPATGGVLYKGVLFSTTSQPGWQRARWFGAYVTNSAVLLGCGVALLIAALVGQPAAAQSLRAAMLALIGLDLFFFVLLYRSLAPVFRARFGPNQKTFFWLTTVAAGWLLPFLLLLQGALLELLPPLLILLGAVTVRNAFVMLPRGTAPTDLAAPADATRRTRSRPLAGA